MIGEVRHPREVDEITIKQYLLYLITEKKPPASTINQIFNALRFLYVDLYKKQFVIGKLPRPKKTDKLPDVLNDEKVIRIFSSINNIKHRTMIMLTYASGCRRWLQRKENGMITLKRFASSIVVLPLLMPFLAWTQQDNTPPTLTAFDFYPKTIDTRLKPDTIWVKFRVTDNLSGASYFQAVFRSPSNTEGRSGGKGFGPSLAHSDSFQIVFPQFSEPGTWKILDILSTDAVGNTLQISTSNLAALGFSTELVVISTKDSKPPTLTTFDFSPKTIDTRLKPDTVWVKFRVTDDLSGVSYFQTVFRSPSNTEGRSGGKGFGPSLAHSDSFQIVFPQFSEPGTWKILDILSTDAVGNTLQISTSNLAALGFSTELVNEPTQPHPVQNINTGLGYATIQEAIDATQTLAGHTISVSKGTFTGNITVTKSLTIIGAGIDSTLLRTSQSTAPVVTITVNNVTLKKLTVRDATGSGTAGIRLQSVSNVIIDSCSITNNFRGIQLTSSSDNTISNSKILSNIENGILLFSSSNRNRITNNTVANTVGGVGDWTGSGINTGDQSSSATIIQGNTIHGNAHSGIISYAGSNNMQIRGNTIYGNANGIMLGWSNGCTIENNTIRDNSHVGINFDTAPNNVFRNNTVSNNTQSGISMMGLGQTGNLIESNTISKNGIHGINIAATTRNSIIRFNTISECSIGVRIGEHIAAQANYGNKVYNNDFIGNTTQAVDNSPEADYWDNGLPEGGNYWSTWTTPDANGDGFVDLPFQVPGGYGRDNYPYARSKGWSPTIITSFLKNGVPGQSYVDTLYATGGIKPFVWLVSGGTLPPGLSLSSSSGIITGIPVETGEYNVRIYVQDSRIPPLTDAKNFFISILPTQQELQIITSVLKEAMAGCIYSDSLMAIGGTPPYQWSVIEGKLPQGIKINSATGIISGLPTNVGNWKFTVRLIDYFQQTASKEFSLIVNDNSAFSNQISLGEGYNPNIAFDYTRQSIYIVYEGLYEILFYKSIDAGTTFQFVTRIDPANAFSMVPSISIDSIGIVGIVWMQSDATAYNIYYRRSIDGGTTWGSPIKVNDTPVSVLTRPRIHSYGNAFYIAWQSDNNIIFIDKTTDGISFGSDVQVNTTGGSHGNPAFVVDEIGKIHIAWRKIGVNHIWYASSVDSGRTFSQHQRVSTENLSYRPSIAAFGGYVYVVWDDTRNIYNDIYCAVSSNRGISFGNSVRVNDNTNNSTQDWAVVGLSSAHDAYIIWRDARTDEMNQDIYFTRSTNLGQSYQTNNRVNSSTGTYNYGHSSPSITIVGNTIFTAWSGTSGIGSKRYIYFSKASFMPSGVTDVVNENINLPANFILHQNYPNPFNPLTVIGYQLPTNSFVSLVLYDMLGREIRTLVNERQNAGKHSITLNAANLPSGVYFYRLQAGTLMETKKLVLLR